MQENIYLNWSDFKLRVVNKENLRYIDRDSFYKLYYSDNISTFETSIVKNEEVENLTDFEDNYKIHANKVKELPKDSDGSPLQRIKITTSGWNYQLHGIELETSKLDSIYSKQADGTNFDYTVIKCYDSNNNELTTQESCDTSAVKTVVDWEPIYDLEIVGGILKQMTLPSEDIRLWVIGVPDIPSEYGGNKSFVANINLKYMGLEEGVRADGRAPKYLTYSEIYHTNKMRLIFTHPAGFKHKVHMIFELFKP